MTGNIPHQKNNQKRGGHNIKNYYLTHDCFKMLCLKAQTKLSDQVYSYYIALEKLFILYIQYQAAFENRQFEFEKTQAIFEKKQLEDILKNRDATLQIKDNELKRKDQELSKYKLLVQRNIIKKEPDSILYVATNNLFQERDQYKIGHCKDMQLSTIRSRLVGYNTAHDVNDPMYFIKLYKVNNAELLDTILKRDLSSFKLNGAKDGKNKEFVCFPVGPLVDIIETLIYDRAKYLDKINAITNENIDEFKCDVVSPIDLDDQEFQNSFMDPNDMTIKKKTHMCAPKEKIDVHTLVNKIIDQLKNELPNMKWQQVRSKVTELNKKYAVDQFDYNLIKKNIHNTAIALDIKLKFTV